MAFVKQTTILRFWFRDNDQTESNTQVQFPALVDGATLQGLVSPYAALMQAISSAIVVRVDVVMRWVEPTPGVADVLSSVRRSGVFTLDSSSPALCAVRVPSVQPGNIITTGPYAGIWLDQSLGEVQAVGNILVNGAHSVQPCDPFGDDITAVSQAFMEQY